MTSQEVKRKLTVILSADVKGYSRLMGEDEKGTVRTLNAYKEVMTGLIQHHHGRVVDAPGDNVLAEFASVVDAVECAVEVQKNFKNRNAELPENRRMEFRIGINLGDVIEESDKIFGDGVNIAARLESLSEAGGICISGTAFDHVKNKLNLGYEYLGEQTVKNIFEPVRVYQVFMEPEAAGKVIGEKKTKPRQWQKAFFVVGTILIVVAASVAIWKFYIRPAGPLEVASKEKMAFPLPDIPSIAVLPFVNMSKDPDQEYFSDGMTEDLITDLSKISGLLVIARDSTFAYKGKPTKVKQVAEELGVRYVLEGSVRRAANDIRINAQLIDAMTGLHLWAERYDGTMGKIFDLQDRITAKIVTALALKLTPGEKAAQGGTEKVAAYDEFLKGWERYLRFTSDDFAKAIQHFKNAVELDPKYGRAHAALALTYFSGSHGASIKSLGVTFTGARLRSRDYLKEALKNPTSIAYLVNAQHYLARRQHEEAVFELERAIALDPNNPAIYAAMGYTLLLSGRPREAVDFINRAIRLDPLNPSHYLHLLGGAQFCMGNLEEAAALIEKGLRINPELTRSASWLMAIYGLLGKEKEARAALEIFSKGRAAEPRIRNIMYFFPFSDPVLADRFAEGLIKAGVPGRPSEYLPSFKENRLTGEEIKRLLFGSTITGIPPGGQQWWIDRGRDGRFTWRGQESISTGKNGQEPVSSDTGKSWIEGDMICQQYQKRLWGLEFCSTVFRNPKGTDEGKDEYFLFQDFGSVAFSLVK